jgi:hypothetical protein
MKALSYKEAKVESFKYLYDSPEEKREHMCEMKYAGYKVTGEKYPNGKYQVTYVRYSDL